MNHDIFISYSNKQKSIADDVCHYLEENGFKCWMAPRDIPIGGEYGDLIEEAIKSCKVVVLVFSAAAALSKWVKGEINVAFTEDKLILPFRVDETEIKGSFRVMLNQMHWIDAFPHYADRLPDLLNSISGVIGKQPEPVEVAGDNRGKERKNVCVTPNPKRKKLLWIALCTAIVSIAVLILTLLKKPNKPLPSNTVGEDLVFPVNGVSFVMKPVEGGTFQMGSNDSISHEDESPVHHVTISSFYMSETEVTQALWKAVMEFNPSHHTGANLPVEQVNWFDCQNFIVKLNELTGESFRLPTEAEWEYAARGGQKSCGFIYSGSDMIDSVAWYSGTTNGESTMPVKMKLPNELGLYDMSGNVWEWCSDWYDGYNDVAQSNPQGPLNGSSRVLRGGSYSNNSLNEKACRVSRRNASKPDRRGDGRGFRIVLVK